jgi:molybdopterin molybdotransferase
VRAVAKTASFLGLPGNPVSSFVTFVLFARPFILKTQGIEKVLPQVIDARADFDWLEPDPRREFLRVKWNQSGGLDLYRTQDSAVLTSTVWADGLADNPERQVIRKGDTVRFLSFANLFQ